MKPVSLVIDHAGLYHDIQHYGGVVFCRRCGVYCAGPLRIRLLAEPCRRYPNDIETKRRLAKMRKGEHPFGKARAGEKLDGRAVRFGDVGRRLETRSRAKRYARRTTMPRRWRPWRRRPPWQRCSAERQRPFGGALIKGLGTALGLNSCPPVAEETGGEEELGLRRYRVNECSVAVPRDALFVGRYGGVAGSHDAGGGEGAVGSHDVEGEDAPVLSPDFDTIDSDPEKAAGGALVGLGGRA